MKIYAMKFGLATAVVFAVFWMVCGLLVASMPVGMMRMSGHMVHADLGQVSWHLGWGGFLYGLLAWSIISGVVAWAIAAVYNRLLG
jgi:hypothetical protein